MPSWVQTLIQSGHIADLVLAVLALEVAGLALWRRQRGRPMGLKRLAAAALPGACLVLALRAALTAADPLWIALWLGAALPAHLLDLWLRPTA
jgi:hypothetical protein